MDRTVWRLCLYPGGGCCRIDKKRERVAHVLKWRIANFPHEQYTIKAAKMQGNRAFQTCFRNSIRNIKDKDKGYGILC